MQGSTFSGSAKHKGAASSSRDELDTNIEDLASTESREGATSADASSVNEIKDTPVASVEELQNLAGGSDIKVTYFVHTQIIFFLRMDLRDFDAVIMKRWKCGYSTWVVMRCS